MSGKQMRRNQNPAQDRKETLLHLIPLIAGVLALVLGVVYVLSLQSSPGTGGTLGPRLQIDREQIDLGKQIFDRPVRATFSVKNVGDSPLKLDVPKIATLLEGC